MATVFRTLSGPRLIRLLKSDNREGRDYVPNFLESSGDKFMQVIHACWSISWWSSPVIMTVLYRRGYFSHEGMVSLSKFLFSVGVVYAGAFCLRGLGRLTNPDYTLFINILIQVLQSPTASAKRALHHYDFEFWAWPVDFKWNETSESKGERVGRSKIQAAVDRRQKSPWLAALPVRALSYCAIHTFGRRMVYPGATSLMQTLIGNMLNQGRASLIEEKKGKRAKVLTEDNNEIDTMFVDRRRPGSGHSHGNTLVVCCEGNAGFYEMGCSGTPLECGFSVLGWNHPGFAGSSGVPFPDSEQKAIDAVMTYAIYGLGFQPDSIVIFAWSIGGYSASWAAMNYPDVKYVILDATFDDALPLALTQMPSSMAGVVTTAMKTYMNLNIADQLLKYPGPIKLIRRVRDEIIATEKTPAMTSVLSSNRGNHLLIRLLQYRYPKIVDSDTTPLLEQYLSGTRQHQDSLMMEHLVVMEECEAKLRSYAHDISPAYPMLIGDEERPAVRKQLTLYLAYRYMEDYDSTHCTPLPAAYLSAPWSPVG
ncbi:phosphatidylserine lipase ABHD16A-like [Babylonia areolata]|uniref:phosphatidylserine lipase ABHD16A-like n=1 Tax=Babylonia areolata TaxID=304850 RepID=UPI003FD54D4E